MIIYTRQMLADDVAKRWRKAYCKNGKWNPGTLWRSNGKTKEEIYNLLVKLGEHPEPDEVDRVIGNGSWTALKCNECGKDCEMIIEVGEPPDYESRTAHLCDSCVIMIYQAMDAHK